MKGFGARARVAEVEALIEARVARLGAERLPFSRALGRILAEDLEARDDVPPYPKSAMDGYAVRAADLPGSLLVIAELMADDVLDGRVEPGQAARIMTGARLPSGADTVIMVEDTKLAEPRVEIAISPPAGTHILAAGEDLRAGTVALRAGRRLRPQDVAMLVALGALEVLVTRRPRVRIVPTGSELVRVGAPNPDRKVVESNSFMLEALARRDGAEVTLHPIVRDDPALLRAAMVEVGADLIVLTGGSSVGQEDLGPLVLREIGELPIHGVHVKPASPTGLGFVNGVPVLLAPGYPVASMVAWDLFARPIVQRMAGAPVRLPYRTARARLAADYEKPAGRRELQRVRLADGLATIIRGGAALLSTATAADGFLVLPEGVERFAAGAELDVHLYEPA